LRENLFFHETISWSGNAFFAAHVSSSSIAEFFAIAMAFIMMSVAVLAYVPISHECLDG
jgi:hypothetical protein